MDMFGSNVPKLSSWRFNPVLRKSEYGWRDPTALHCGSSGEDLEAPVLVDFFLNTLIVPNSDSMASSFILVIPNCSTLRLERLV